jgi:putative ABC transport system permease protein
VLGAGREKLILQFTMESVLFSLIALPAALLLSELMAKYFYNILNCDIGSFPLFEHGFIFYLIAVPVVLGLLSGLYTAFYSVKKISAEDIQGNKVISTNSLTRRLLIGFQFLVFTGLLISSFIIYKQMQLMISDDLGYNRDNTLIVDIPHDDKYLKSVPAFIEELKTNNSIINASYTSSLPPSVGNTLYSRTNSSVDPQKKLDIQFITCDKNFIPTMGLKLIEGKNFGDPKNNTNEVIVNELAVKKLGLKEPVLGKTILFNGNNVHIIGVIRNFYSQSFYKPLMPLVLTNSSQYSSKIIIKYRQKNLDQAISSVKKNWKNFFQNSILNISFSDKEFQKVYDNDLRFSKVIFLFTLIAIFISVIGLASLTSITAARRRKEIGIRKVMGASVAEVMVLLGKEIFYISLIGALIAWPLSFYFIGAWLDNYTYKTHLTLLYPLLAFLAGLTIAFTTISFQTFKAAAANPVDSLRHE